MWEVKADIMRENYRKLYSIKNNRYIVNEKERAELAM